MGMTFFLAHISKALTSTILMSCLIAFPLSLQDCRCTLPPCWHDAVLTIFCASKTTTHVACMTLQAKRRSNHSNTRLACIKLTGGCSQRKTETLCSSKIRVCLLPHSSLAISMFMHLHTRVFNHQQPETFVISLYKTACARSHRGVGRSWFTSLPRLSCSSCRRKDSKHGAVLVRRLCS